MQMAHMKFRPHKLRGLILFLKSREILKYLSNMRLMMHYQTKQTRMSLEGNTKVFPRQDPGTTNHFHQILHFQKQKQRATAHWILLFVYFTQIDHIQIHSLHYQDQFVTSAILTPQNQVSKTPKKTHLYRKSCYHHIFFSRTTRHEPHVLITPKINYAVSLVSTSTLQALRFQRYDKPVFHAGEYHFHQLMQTVRIKLPLVNVQHRRQRQGRVK